MLRKLFQRYLFSKNNKIIFTDSDNSYTRAKFLKKTIL